MAEVLVFPQEAVLHAIQPDEAIERVRHGFVEYAGNEWQMPPKTYLDASPNGDFRAMPAKGAELAILKWVTSFPGNPEAGLPVVMGVICVSSVSDGEPLALVDVRSITALRTGAVAAVAAQGLARGDHRLRPARDLGGALPRRGGVRPGRLFRPRPRGGRAARGRAGLGGGQPRGRPRVRHRHLRDARQRARGTRGRPAARPPSQHARRRRAGQGRGRARGRGPGRALLRRMGTGEPRRRADRSGGGGARDARTGHRAGRGAHGRPPGAFRAGWGYAVRLHGSGDPGPRALSRAPRSAPCRARACGHRPAVAPRPASDIEAMRKLILTLAVISIAAPVAMGCGKEDEAVSGAAELAPAGTVMYGEATLKPEGDQKEAIDAILAKFPGGGQAGDKLKDLIEKESDAPINFKEDIQPWL